MALGVAAWPFGLRGRFGRVSPRDGDGDGRLAVTRRLGASGLHGGRGSDPAGGRMPLARRMRPSWAAVIGLACLSSCGSYEPVVQGDHSGEKYKTDLATCQADLQKAVYLKNAATIGTWIISPFTGPPAVRAAIRACLKGKGYAVVE